MRLLRSIALLRAAGWILLGVATLEVAARVEDRVRYGADLTAAYDIDSIFINDENGHHGRPNASYLRWRMNEVGYRGPALRPGTYRIACLGSSETFGLYESPSKEWPRQLEDKLSATYGSSGIEVVDTAYPGLSVATSVEHLPRMLALVRPQMVVIYPSYTPYIDPPERPNGANLAVRSQSHSAEGAPFIWRTSGRFNTLMKATLPEEMQHRLRLWQMEQEARHMKVMDRLPEENVARFREDLDALVSGLQKNGVRVILVTHANRFGAEVRAEDREFLSDWRKFFPDLKEEGLLDMERRMSAAVRTVAGAREIPLVDAARRMPGGARNFAEFVHFTDAGADELSREVANQVRTEVSATELTQSHTRHVASADLPQTPGVLRNISR